MKRLLAMLLCLSMVLGLVPAMASAKETARTGTVVTAQELPGESRLDGAALPQKESVRLHEDDEMVTVIVEFTGEPLLSGFTPKTGSSVGKQVSEYLRNAAPEAQALEGR